MANKEQTYTLKLDAEIGNLTASAEKVKKALSDIGALGKFPELDRGLEAVFKKLDKIKETAAAPVKGSTFTSLGKDAASVGVQLSKLLDTLTDLARNTDGAALDILPPDMLQKLRSIDAAMSAYNTTIDNASKKTKELIDAENALAAAEGRLEGWQNKLADATAARNNASTSVAATREELNAAQQRIEATRREVEERREAIKELEKLYESQGADKRKEIVDDKGNTRNLRKERNQLARLEGGLPEQQEAIAGLEAQITIGEKSIKSYNDRIAECNGQIGNWTAAVERNRNAVTSLNESFEDGKITAAKKAYADLRKEAERLGIDVSDLPIEGTADDMQELEDRVQSLSSEITEMATTALNGAKQSFEGSDKAVEDFKNSVSDAKDECDEFNASQQKLNSIKDNIKQFIGWAGAAKVLSAALRNAFEDIKELDKAMTEIAVVTDFNIGNMWSQLPEYTDRANELGLSITSVYEASALFYQQGLSTNEMVALSNETLKMAKIAGLDAAEATDRMTAALRGFNMELNEASAQKVADVYSELAAITASDVDEISTAMTKTASIASSAGMEFETTAAFLSQIIETTRESAETAGTAMKTVIARFQELKKSPDEIGEIDGEIVDANQIEKALRSVGVSLSAKGEFRELDDVFLELSSKWGELDKNTQRYIATIAAGSRQQSRFIAMMQDYDRTQELVTAANNSAGASSQQYAKTMESLETKLTQLDNAWTEFSTGLMNSDFVKAAVDFLTFLLNGINKATEGFGSFTSSLSKISVLVAVFQTAKHLVSKFFDEIIQKVYLSAQQAGKNIAEGTSEGLKAKKSVKNGALGNMKEGLGLVSSGLSKNAKGVRNITAARQKISELTVQATKNEEKYRQKIAEAGDDKQKLARIEYERGEQLKRENQAMQEAQVPINNTIAGINKMAQGAAAASQALMFAGMGVSALGSAIAESGAEEAGETISGIGNALTTVGSIMMGLVPVVKFVSTQIAANGVKAMLPWLWVILILTAVIATVAIVANAIKKSSPEYKMEQLTEATDKASNAAERAEKAYDNLVKSLESLDTGYKTIAKLTRGTKEWQDAVEDVNSQVLDLITQYPELSKFVDNEGGVLTIDTEKAEVQEVLNQAKQSAVVAKNSLVMANLAVNKQQNELAYKNLDNNAKFDQGSAAAAGIGAGVGAAVTGAGVGAAIGTIIPGIGNAVGAIVGGAIGLIAGTIGGIATGLAAQEAAFEDTQTETEKLAKAIASGAIVDTGSSYAVKDAKKLEELNIDSKNLQIYYQEVGENTEDLRQFGEQLLLAEEQEKAAFSAIAANAMSLANTLAMSEQQIAQAGNVVDHVASQELYNQKMSELGDQDFTKENGSGEMDDEEKALRDRAIEAQYGAGARIEGDTVYYRDENNKQVTEKLTSDEIKAIIANQYATEGTAKLIEDTPRALAQVTNLLANEGTKRDEGMADALATVFEDEEGGNLTKEELDKLSMLTENQLKDTYDKLDADYKKVFGNVDNFLNKTKGAVDIANNAFAEAEAKAGEFGVTLSSWMTADLATGFTTKLQQVLEASGPEAVTYINDMYNKLISGKSDAVAAEITQLLNSVDWTNQEKLLALQAELEDKYGYSREEAVKFTEAMGEAAKATAVLAEAVRVFGELYQAIQKLNIAVENTSNIEWKYERALRAGADAAELSMLLEEKRLSIQEEVTLALEAYDAAVEEQINIYKSGAELKNITGTDVSRFIKYNEDSGSYDLSDLDLAMKRGEFGEEDSEAYKAVVEYGNKLTEANKTAKNQLKTAKDSYKKLEEIEDNQKNSYVDLYEKVEEAILKNLEKQLQAQKDLLDATKTANDRLIDSIQEQIDDDREARELEEASKNLENLQKRLSYLKADSSGANALEILELEEQLASETQSYTDSLVDQQLKILQDTSQQAEEQRERQIALAEAQLEAYKTSNNLETEVKATLDEYLKSYNNHVACVRAFETWEKLSEKDKAKVQDALYLSEEDFAAKYGESEAANYKSYQTMMGYLQTESEKPGPWDPENTELGKAFISGGLTDGMTEMEEDAFWKEIKEKTALAGDSTDALDDYSHGEGKDSQQSLLESIDLKSGFQDLSKAMMTADNAIAANKIDSFNEATGEGGFKFTHRDIDTFTNADGSFNAQSAAKYKTQVDKMETSQIVNTLNDQDRVATDYYNQNSAYTGDENKMYSQSEYYTALANAGDTGVSVGGSTFTQKGLEDSLLEGGTHGSYASYVQAYQTAHGGSVEQFKAAERQRLIEDTKAVCSRGRKQKFFGMKSVVQTQRYKTNLAAFEAAGGSRAEFDEGVRKYVNSGYVEDSDWSWNEGWYGKYPGHYEMKVAGKKNKGQAYKDNPIQKTTLASTLAAYVSDDDPYPVVMHDGELYLGKYNYSDEYYTWYKVKSDADDAGGGSGESRKNYLSALHAYKTGGLADFTGPAWLDGTPSRPEYVLNANQTERFFALIDVLENFGADNVASGDHGDNYFDIDINVESLGSDYDVEQVAAKIRAIIVEDASYRNVNNISLTH